MAPKLPEPGYKIIPKRIAKYVVSDVDRFGNRRWYLRVPGHPKVRLPVGPEDTRFTRAYVE